LNCCSVQHWDAKKKKFIQVQSSELRNKVIQDNTTRLHCFTQFIVSAQDSSSNRRSESGGKVSDCVIAPISIVLMMVLALQIGKKGPTGLYKKWQQSTRGRIQGGGEDEESSVSGVFAFAHSCASLYSLKPF
jgi:hypothetical protein